ncbi:polymeric immunoglobulin receptor isoform X2 [Esox lucius]|uniref:polymeric immunoglobulin receptor isoform X2 n=1 Tax=Esox lucius TaxID=8010 RepID=UPI001476CB0F|nr:polymeric immunoglobulin receptor isoform X2 [Esox lucius]
MVSFNVLLIVFIGWPSVCSSLWTVTKSTARTGGNITVPCHYHRMFKDNVKYWCKGRSWTFCKVMASTNPKWKTGRMLITDSPEELVFTVTMSNLQETDTDKYWCALKVGGIDKPDVKVSLSLKVTKALPDLSVVEEELSGEEGGSIRVQCVYSDPLRDKAKWWCRSGDWHSCQTQTETSQNASVVIKDDKSGVFNVTIRKLERKDSGWYWCSVGDLQAPVHINVIQRPTTHRNITVTPPTSSTLHLSFSSSETSVTTFSLKTSPSLTSVTALTTTYPPVSIPYITVHSSTLIVPLSTTQPSKDSKTTVIHQMYLDRSSRNNARPMEGEMVDLVIDQDNQNQLE